VAISLDPATKVITIPQADLTFVSGTLYELDTNQFRKDVTTLLSSETYIWMDDAYSHNGEVTVAGTTFSRTLEFINGYSVKFEDTGSQYSVNLQGSNNNIFDVENGILVPTDKVTVISNNSGGLIGGQAILDGLEYLDQKVYINTESLSPGNGTQGDPFNTWTAAIDFAETEGFRRLVLLADATVDRQIKNFEIEGIGEPSLDFNGQNMDSSTLIGLSVTGTMLGTVSARACTLNSASGLDGLFIDTGLIGTNTLAAGANVTITQGFSRVAGLARPTIDMNALSTGASLSLRGYSGGLTVTNCDHADDVATLEISQGKVELAASCTAGTISVRGLATLLDNSAGTTVDVPALLSPEDVIIKLNNNFAISAAGL
jgi:hypothetical protein